MRETVMKRVPRRSRGKSPWDTELIMWVKKTAVEEKLFAPVSYMVKGTEFCAVFPTGLYQRLYCIRASHCPNAAVLPHFENPLEPKV